jgi:hypothetical protein|tara:strand:- start:599 stop:853 length:255 start_codon:yes stop_codon:yes gene_type:complete
VEPAIFFQYRIDKLRISIVLNDFTENQNRVAFRDRISDVGLPKPHNLQFSTLVAHDSFDTLSAPMPQSPDPVNFHLEGVAFTHY